MLGIHFRVLLAFLLIIVLAWHFLSSSLAFSANKRTEDFPLLAFLYSAAKINNEAKFSVLNFIEHRWCTCNIKIAHSPLTLSHLSPFLLVPLRRLYLCIPVCIPLSVVIKKRSLLWQKDPWDKENGDIEIKTMSFYLVGRTSAFLLTHWFWTARWQITVKGDHTLTPLDNSHTNGTLTQLQIKKRRKRRSPHSTGNADKTRSVHSLNISCQASVTVVA